MKDRIKLLQQDKSIVTMERLEMIVSDITYPFPHVARVSGRINPADLQAWKKANIAVRMAVGGVEGDRPLTRVYTIRRFDADNCLAEIDFVIHQGDAPAMRWLSTAKAGTSVLLLAAKQHFVPDYASGKPIIFFADDTAIPALYSMLAQWPEGARARLYIDCADEAYAGELPQIETITAHIHVRGAGEEAGKSGYLPAAAQAIEAAQNWQIWVACEREEARAIRQHFMTDCGLPKENIKAIGYWRYGLSSSQLDRARLAHFTKLQESGEGIAAYEELDAAV